MSSISVKSRFLVSAGANVLRAGVGFITGLLLARGLGPAQYGDMAFLLGTFLSIRALLDMGSSSAFYTFISQRSRTAVFFLRFIVWLGLQFVLTLLFVWILAPDALFHRIWLNHSRELVALALMASFIQQPVWTVVGYIGESMRRTVQVQALSLAISVLYLLSVLILMWLGTLSLHKVFYLIVVQYSLATAMAYSLWRREIKVQTAEESSLGSMLQEYKQYCMPMITLSMVTFFYSFLDRWLLQLYGGSSQQAFFQVASQFSLVSLLATTSIMNIFWKEIADAWQQQDHARVARLYRIICRGLVLFSAAVTALILPWAEHAVTALLGRAYTDAWPVLAIMLLYPIHQSLGQINGSMHLACGRTKVQMLHGLLGMLIGMPATYFLLAPATATVPGLGLGAMGLALKLFLINIFLVNFQVWLLARHHRWSFDWRYQGFGLPILIGLGYLAYIAAYGLSQWGAPVQGRILIYYFLLAAVLYSGVLIFILLKLPSLLGLGNEEQALIANAWCSVNGLVKRKLIKH